MSTYLLLLVLLEAQIASRTLSLHVSSVTAHLQRSKEVAVNALD